MLLTVFQHSCFKALWEEERQSTKLCRGHLDNLKGRQPEDHQAHVLQGFSNLLCKQPPLWHRGVWLKGRREFQPGNLALRAVGGAQLWGKQTKPSGTSAWRQMLHVFGLLGLCRVVLGISDEASLGCFGVTEKNSQRDPKRPQLPSVKEDRTRSRLAKDLRARGDRP